MTTRVLVMGIVGGHVMALASGAALSYIVLRLIEPASLERWVDRGVPRALVVVQISVGAFVTWMFIGLVLASAYLAGNFAEDPGALGSPSVTFTAIVVALAFLPLPPLILLWRRPWWLWCGLSGLFAAFFGWLLPLSGE